MLIHGPLLHAISRNLAESKHRCQMVTVMKGRTAINCILVPQALSLRRTLLHAFPWQRQSTCTSLASRGRKVQVSRPPSPGRRDHKHVWMVQDLSQLRIQVTCWGPLPSPISLPLLMTTSLLNLVLLSCSFCLVFLWLLVMLNNLLLILQAELSALKQIIFCIFFIGFYVLWSLMLHWLSELYSAWGLTLYVVSKLLTLLLSPPFLLMALFVSCLRSLALPWGHTIFVFSFCFFFICLCSTWNKKLWISLILPNADNE